MKEVRMEDIKIFGHPGSIYIQMNRLPLEKTFGIVAKTKTVHETNSQMINLDYDKKGKLFGIEIMWSPCRKQKV
jgi:hypothetical protein